MLKKKVKSAVNCFCRMFPDAKNIIDVGCREGYSIEYFLKKDKNPLGIEIKMPKKGYPRIDVRGCVVVDDFLGINITPTGTKDAVFSRHSIEHMDTKAFFKRCSEVLKPGGILFIVFPLQQWATLNRGLDDEKEMLSIEDSMSDFFKEPKDFKTTHFGKTSEFGIKPMDIDYLWVGEKI